MERVKVLVREIEGLPKDDPASRPSYRESFLVIWVAHDIEIILSQDRGRNQRFLRYSLSETKPCQNIQPSLPCLLLNSSLSRLNSQRSPLINRHSIGYLPPPLRSRSNPPFPTTSTGTTILLSLRINTYLRLPDQPLLQLNGNLLHLLLPRLLPLHLNFPLSLSNNSSKAESEDLNLLNRRNSNTKLIKLDLSRCHLRLRIMRKVDPYLEVSKKRVSCSGGI